MATFDPEHRLRRREPVQERSRARVRRILTAAMELVEIGGEAAVTTRAIARQAGVPVATIYQFFPNRDAILLELLQEHLDQRDAGGVAVLATLHDPTLAELMRTVFDYHRIYLRDHPQVVALFYASRSAGLLPDPAQRRARFAEALHVALLQWALLPPGTDPAVSTMVTELGERVLELAYTAGPERGRQVFAEGERALIAYLSSYTAGS